MHDLISFIGKGSTALMLIIHILVLFPPSRQTRQLRDPFLVRYEAEADWLRIQRALPSNAFVKDRQSLNKSSNGGLGHDLLSPLLIPRPVPSKGHSQVQLFLIDFFTRLKWHIQKDSFEQETVVGKRTFTNYIFTMDPAAPRKLVLAAHYDSKIFREFDFVGATDSSVPCAVLLGVAQALHNLIGQNQSSIVSQGDRSLQLIFFDGGKAFIHQY